MLEHPEIRQYDLEAWELGWLSAAWESEGYFTVVKAGGSGKFGNGAFYPRLGIANSDRSFMDRVQRLVFVISGKLVNVRQFPSKRKPMFRIDISHYATVQAVIEAVLPYLCGKREVAELVLKMTTILRVTRGMKREERIPYHTKARELNNSARVFNRENLNDLDNQQGTLVDSSETNEQPLDEELAAI